MEDYFELEILLLLKTSQNQSEALFVEQKLLQKKLHNSSRENMKRRNVLGQKAFFKNQMEMSNIGAVYKAYKNVLSGTDRFDIPVHFVSIGCRSQGGGTVLWDAIWP